MTEPEQARQERLRAKELRRQQNKEAWKKNPANAMARTYFSDRYKGKVFSVHEDPKVGILHTYQELVRKMSKEGADKKKTDECIDTLLAGGRIFMFDLKELQKQADRDAPAAQMKDIEDIIRKAGPKGCTKEDIKLAMRARGWTVEGLLDRKVSG